MIVGFKAKTVRQLDVETGGTSGAGATSEGVAPPERRVTDSSAAPTADGSGTASDDVGAGAGGKNASGSGASALLRMTVGDSPVNVVEGSKVHLEVTPTGGKPPYAVSWDLNQDGTEDASGVKVDADVPDAGDYDAQVRLTDASGTKVYGHVRFTAAVAKPEVTVTAPATAFTDAAVVFSSVVTDSPKKTAGGFKYSWDCGDGSIAGSAGLSHRYSKAGTYKVTLTVKDSANQTGTATANIVVSDKVFVALRNLSVNAASGSDASNGLAGAAVRSLSRAAALAQPGDQIDIAPGNYDGLLINTLEGTADHPIIFKGQAGVVLNAIPAGGATDVVSLSSTKHLIFDSITVDCPPGADGLGSKLGDDTVFQNSTVMNCRYGIVSKESRLIKVLNSSITSPDQSAAPGLGINLTGSTDSAIIRGNIISGFGGSGIQFSGPTDGLRPDDDNFSSGNVVENNRIVHNTYAPGNVGGGGARDQL